MSEEERTEQATTLKVGRDTLVPIGSVLVVVSFLVKIWLAIAEIESRQDAEINELKRIEREHWTCQQREVFFYELRIMNPDLKVPALPGSCGGGK